MVSLFTHSSRETTVAVFDIGSASVGGAIIRFREGEKPLILWSGRESMVFQQDLNFGRFLSSMLESLGKVAKAMHESGVGTVRNFFCVLSSPWYASQTRVVKMRRDAPEPVTRRSVTELVRREIDRFKAANIEKYARVGEEEMEIMETHTIQIKLNGYPTAHPYGTLARSMEMSLYISMAPRRVLDSVRARIGAVMDIKKMQFGSFSLVAFSTIRDMFAHKNNFLFMDISGEVSDISLVKGNVLLETASFPLGKNFLLRRIASGINTVPEEAITLLTLSREGKTTENVRGRVEGILRDSRAEWIRSLKQALGSLSDDLSLPDDLFFTSDPDVAPWFSDCLMTPELGEYTGTGLPFEVVFLDDATFKNFTTADPKISRDSFLMLESVFADRIIESGHL